MTEIISLKDQLNEIAENLKAKYGVKVFFCEIIGKRWSFYAGDMTLDIPDHRFSLTSGLGMMTGKISCKEEEWKKVIKSIKMKLPA